jgi:hypothetical protein
MITKTLEELEQRLQELGAIKITGSKDLWLLNGHCFKMEKVNAGYSITEL